MLAIPRVAARPFKPQLASTEGGNLRYNNDSTQTRLHLETARSSSPSTDLKHVTISDHDIVFSHLKVDRSRTNRLFNVQGHSRFVTVHFQIRLESHKAACEYIEQVLSNGITINGCSYSFLGHSNSQLAEKTCVLYACNDWKEAERFLAEWGDFNSIRNPAKCAKRIGLLFSGMQPMQDMPQLSHVMIPDIQANGLNFTDGCGLMSPRLAKSIAVKTKSMLAGQRYIPSVVQLRYRGFKGVVQFDPSLCGQNDLALRPSQEKFKEPPPCKPAVFGFVKASLPYNLGCLNKQFIMLLSAMGIPDNVFEAKQAQYFAQLATMRSDPRTALKFLMTHKKVEVASLLAVSDLGVNDPEVSRQLQVLQRKLIQAGIKQSKPAAQRIGVDHEEQPAQQSKLRIQVDQSRVVFGVADTSCSLDYGECFFQPTIDGMPCMLTDTFVLVGRNPCYHCGDLRVLKATRCESLRHLKDCIVFPVQGARPHADEMAGGDLDGDIFFVCWDPDLIPHQSRLHSPMSYSAAAEKPHGTVGTADRIKYFANHRPGILGKLDRCYNQWANLKGVACRECAQLADLFSLGVDSVKTGQQQKIPDALVMPDDLAAQAEEEGKSRIWNKLQLRAEHFSNAYRAHTLQTQGATSLAATLEEEDTWQLLSSQDLCISEEQLLHIVTEWCKAHHSDQFLQMMMHIDFGCLKHEQRMYALQAGVPRNIVFNALNQSHLLTMEDRLSFQLETEGPLHWKLLGAGKADSADAAGQLQRALTQHHKKLLVFTVQPKPQDPAQTIAIYIPETYPEPGRYDAGGKIVSFVFCNGLRRKQVFHKYQTLEFDPLRLQIFARQTRQRPATLAEQRQQASNDLANSFLWLKHQGGRWSISVAVARFDASAYSKGQLQAIRKQSLSYEIYVVNSRVPVEQPWLTVPETVQQHTRPLTEGPPLATVAAQNEDTNTLVVPQNVATEDMDAAKITQLAGDINQAQQREVGNLMTQLAAENKCGALQILVQQVGAECALQSDSALQQMLLCVARLNAVDFAAQLVTMMLTAPSMQEEGVHRAFELCQRCGLLRSCPHVALLLWAHAKESWLPAAAANKQDMLELARAAIRAASFTMGAHDMLQELLSQKQLQTMSSADTASLLSSCLLECPDRECAISLVKLIRLMLIPSANAGPATANQQSQGPSQDMPSQQSRSHDVASSSTEVTPVHSLMYQGVAALTRITDTFGKQHGYKHWSSLLTLDLLAEMQETLTALSTSSQLPSQAAEQSGFVPAHTTVWDYIAQKTDSPDFTRAIRAVQMPAQASKGPRAAGKPPVVLSNMCASCKEKKTAQHPGEGICSVAFASNKGAAIAPGHCQPGDLVRLSAMSCQNSAVPFAAYNQRFVEGKVAAVQRLHVEVELPFTPARLQDHTWRLEKLGNLVTYERCIAALQKLGSLSTLRQGPSPSVLKIVTETWAIQQHNRHATAASTSQHHQPCSTQAAAEKEQIAPSESVPQLQHHNCNQSQAAAVVAAASQALTLIHGPPGTGKTHTIVQLLLLAMREQDAKVRPAGPLLVTAQTNTAVDNILRKLISNLAANSPRAASEPSMLMRVGEPKSVSKDLQQHCLETTKGIKNNAGFLDRRAVKAALQQARIVFTTCAGAGSQQVALQQYAFVVVDEASQVTEPGTLVPMVLGASQLVLVGDHKQLGPCVSSLGQKEGLDISLFERLLSTGISAHMLNVQYRMHPDIAEWPSKQYYGGQLLNGGNTLTSRVPSPLQTPLTFQEVPGWETLGASKTNPRQAEAAVHLVHQLIQANEVAAQDVGVITPYKAMAQLLQTKLEASADCRAVKVDTVDAFQGQEKRVILFVTVRANGLRSIGFLEDQRRLNVALTRAIHALVVLGHKATVQHVIPHWK